MLVRASRESRGRRTSASTSRRRGSTSSRPRWAVPASITSALPCAPCWSEAVPESATATAAARAVTVPVNPIIRMCIIRMTYEIVKLMPAGLIPFPLIERSASQSATSIDVARCAGVSQSTVSLVLSGKAQGRVSEATQERVRECARELCYLPNVAAQTLRLGTSRAVALLVPDVTNPFFSRVLRGAQRAAQAAGFTVALVDTANDRRWEAQSFEALRAGPVDGYLLFEVSAPEALEGDENVVLMEAEAPKRPSVRFDAEAG